MAPVTGISGLPAVDTLAPLQLVTPAELSGTDAGVEVSGGSFKDLLAEKLGSVVDLQRTADAQSQAVASGQSDDLTAATIAVEKASIATELVSGIRNKAVEAYQDVMRMQV